MKKALKINGRDVMFEVSRHDDVVDVLKDLPN